MYPDIKYSHPNSKNLIVQITLLKKFGFEPLQKETAPTAWIHKTPSKKNKIYLSDESMKDFLLEAPRSLTQRYTFISEKEFDEMGKENFNPLYLKKTLIKNNSFKKPSFS